MRSIFALGFFADVQVDIKSTPKGKEIIFVVVEKPSIKDIGITGNQKVKYDQIKEQLTLTPRSILNLEKVKENAELIRKLYFSKGYYGVKVDYQVDYLETNEAVVTFKILEGPKGYIKKIVFKGNKKIKSSELRKVMQTKQRNIFSIITKTGRLDEDILKNDLQIVTAYYVDHGYLEAKVFEPRIDLSDPTRIKIEIEISEGPQYRVGEVDFKGDLLTTKEDLSKSLRSNEIKFTAIQRSEGMSMPLLKSLLTRVMPMWRWNRRPNQTPKIYSSTSPLISGRTNRSITKGFKWLEIPRPVTR